MHGGGGRRFRWSVDATSYMTNCNCTFNRVKNKRRNYPSQAGFEKYNLIFEFEQADEQRPQCWLGKALARRAALSIRCNTFGSMR